MIYFDEMAEMAREDARVARGEGLDNEAAFARCGEFMNGRRKWPKAILGKVWWAEFKRQANEA